MDATGGRGSFIVVDLGVGHPGVVIDDCMDEGVTEQFVAPAAAFDPWRGRTIFCALSAADEAPTAANRNVAQLFNIDVDQRASMSVFIATDLFTGSDIDVRQPIQSTPHQHGVNRRGWHGQSRGYRQR